MTKQNVRIKVHFREAFSGAPLPILDPPEARFLNLPTNKPIAPGKAKYFPNDSTSVYEFSDISENTVIRMDVSGQLAKGGKSEFSTASCVLRLDVPEGSHILRDIYLLCLAPANADLSEVKFCLDPSSLTADPSASRQGITIRVTNTSYKRSHTDPGSVWYVPYFHDFPLGEDGTVSVSLPVGDYWVEPLVRASETDLTPPRFLLHLDSLQALTVPIFLVNRSAYEAVAEPSSAEPTPQTSSSIPPAASISDAQTPTSMPSETAARPMTQAAAAGAGAAAMAVGASMGFAAAPATAPAKPPSQPQPQPAVQATVPAPGPSQPARATRSPGTVAAKSATQQSPATTVIKSGTPQSVMIKQAFAALEVMVTDAGNPVNGAKVTFTAPDNGPSGEFPGGTNKHKATTNAEGMARAAILTANATAGTYDVVASVVGGGSVKFALTNLAESTVTGRILDRHGQPASARRVFAIDHQGKTVGEAKTNQEGHYKLFVPAGQTLTVKVESPGDVFVKEQQIKT